MKLTLFLAAIALAVFSGATTLSAAALLTDSEMASIYGGCVAYCYVGTTCGVTGPGCGDACPNGMEDCRPTRKVAQYDLDRCYNAGAPTELTCKMDDPYACGFEFTCSCEGTGAEAVCRVTAQHSAQEIGTSAT